MKKKITLLLSLTISLSFFANLAYAQKFRKRNRYQSIGATVNAMNYVGDLDPGASMISPSLNLTKLNVGVVYLYRYASHLSLRAAFSYGRIAGDDQKSSSAIVSEDVGRYERNLSFRNDIKELKGDIVYDIIGNRRGLQRRVNFTPYLFIGAAFYHHAPKTKYDGSWVDLQEIGTEGQNLPDDEKEKLNSYGESYSKWRISVPLGIGFRYKLARMWDLAFEIGWRYTFFDHLDDVSGVQFISLAENNKFDKSLLESGEFSELAIHLHDRSIEGENVTTTTDDNGYEYTSTFAKGTNAGIRGDKQHDWYIVTGLQLTYIFHPRIVCPKYR